MMNSISASEGYVGQSVRTIEGRAPVAGRARYTSDYEFSGQLHAHIVRSPHAAARIKRVDLTGASKVAGVVLALDGKAVAEHIGPMPHHMDPSLFHGRSAAIRCVALDQVWCYGQAVAVVVATDKRTARYAASRVVVDYEPLPPVVAADQAMAEGTRKVVEGWDVNAITQIPFVNGDVAKAFAGAHKVVKSTIRIHRFSTQPIETRVYNAVWERDTAGFTVYCTAQNPQPMRNQLAEALGMPENKIRIVAPTIGGAFGLKMPGHPEEPLICLLAKLTQRPVKWVEDREECLLVGGREQHHEVELAVAKDGTVLGLRDRFLANTGAPSACPGWAMAFLTGLTMPGPYVVKNIDVLATIAVSNKPSWNASRGYGKEATALALELSMDNAARALGMDPIELRLKNYLPSTAFPYNSPTGLIYDSGDYAGVTRKALDVLGYAEWKAKRDDARRQGRYLGIGLAYELTPEGGSVPGTLVAGYDSSTVRISPDGSVTVLTGVTTPGTGNPTGIAQIVADELGIDFAGIEVVQGDTTACPYGFGNYSGRSTIVGGGAAALAAQELRGRLMKLAAAMLGVAESTVIYRNSAFTSDAAAGKSLSFKDVCFAAYSHVYDVASCITPALEATCTYKPGLIRHTPDANGHINPYPSYSNGAYATVCEVDIDTGVITLLKCAVAHDCGRPINPRLVEGQACGAVAFGIGGMLSEEICSDAEGHQLTRSFMDYVMPRARDVPEIAVAHHDVPNPVSYKGMKGAGEAGVGGSAAAVVNAVNDALAPLGVCINDLPLTPDRVWAAIQAARRVSRREAAE
ncbi:MAG: xanthine dehydrogenase family protein [Alphaproteobacteria bacterium]|nr:xanthine dehydrogenase family protein [Alphaproteobacteria bacterium]